MMGETELFEDRIREEKKKEYENKYSRYCDLVYYESSVTPDIKLAMRVLKPEKPSYILSATHGWHMSIPRFEEANEPLSDYLRLDIDMRGRAFSTGEPDCNGLELFDVIDAIEFAKIHYGDYLISKDVVYFSSGSGGGANGLNLAGKFPDYFAAVTAMCGPSDFIKWYENDKTGEFRDEMEVWIGTTPDKNEEAYKSRSGITVVPNLITPVLIAHGTEDIRVPYYHTTDYINEAVRCGKGDLITLYAAENSGGSGHWTNATQEQMTAIKCLDEQIRKEHRAPVEIPSKGVLVIAGYVVTKKFTIMLDSIDKVGKVEYDLDGGTFSIMADCGYKLIIK